LMFIRRDVNGQTKTADRGDIGGERDYHHLPKLYFPRSFFS
jgi:hypothetical protein